MDISRNRPQQKGLIVRIGNNHGESVTPTSALWCSILNINPEYRVEGVDIRAFCRCPLDPARLRPDCSPGLVVGAAASVAPTDTIPPPFFYESRSSFLRLGPGCSILFS
jgi:hypothetical protein